MWIRFALHGAFWALVMLCCSCPVALCSRRSVLRIVTKVPTSAAIKSHVELFCLNYLLFRLLPSPRQRIGPCDTNVIEGHLFLRDNDINDALQFENMFSPLPTQQVSYELFCVQQPFATLFWAFPGWWVFWSKATFNGSIDTLPTSSRDVWAHKISWYSL